MSLIGLRVSVSGMQAAQAALDITGQNIASANTEGYSRKALQTKDANSVFFSSTNSTPMGVVIDDISRARNVFIENQYRSNISEVGRLEELQAISQAFSDILGDPSNILLNENIQDFYKAASDLAANPELETTRKTFINAADNLADTFNQLDRTMLQYKKDIEDANVGKTVLQVNEANGLMKSISDIQKQIRFQRAAGIDASSLEDKRDQHLADLSKMMDLDVRMNSQGDLYQVRAKYYPDPNAEAQIKSTTPIGNVDAVLIPAIVEGVNNTIDLTFNDGNGTIIGPFTTTFEQNSTMRDIVEKINQTFQNHGGVGNIASLDNDGMLTLETRSITGSINSTASEVTINGGSAVATLGLPAAPVTSNGGVTQPIVLMDATDVYYEFGYESGNDNTAPFHSRLILKDIDSPSSTARLGTIDITNGSIKGLMESGNSMIPDMRNKLDSFAMSIKDQVNKLLSLGVTNSGNPGSPLFKGNYAGDFAVNDNISSNPDQLATGLTPATGDSSIISQISELFFDSEALISSTGKAEKVFLDSSSPNSVRSKLAVIPGEDIKGAIVGTISDNGTLINATDNTIGPGSAVQIIYYAADGVTQVGPAIDITGDPPPENEIEFNDTVPAGAAFMAFQMNTAFGDADLTNNEGNFAIDIIQSEVGLSRDFNSQAAITVGSFGQNAKFYIDSLDTAQTVDESIRNQIESISGVSLEEESANLMLYQNAFSANAQVFTTMNQIIQEILNMV